MRKPRQSVYCPECMGAGKVRTKPSLNSHSKTKHFPAFIVTCKKCKGKGRIKQQKEVNPK